MSLTYGSLPKDTHTAVVRCPFPECNTRLIDLTPNVAQSVVTIENSPTMLHPSHLFFQVGDVWDFDNIGVSRPTELTNVSELAKVERLLICGECDKGPLGFAGFVDAEETDVKKLTYYLSAESVRYEV